MVRKIIINLSNKWLYTFIAIGVVILLGVGVYAVVDTSQGWHPWSQIGDIPAGFADGIDNEGGADGYNVDNEPTATGRGEPTKNEIISWGADGYEANTDTHVTSVNGLTGGTISGNIVLSGNIFHANSPAATTIYNNHRYAYFSSAKTFYNARLACESYGGYLATIGNTDENNAINSIKSGVAYIGYTDAHSEGNWAWITGEIMVTGDDAVYTNWNIGEPSNSGGEDCAGIGWFSNPNWNDIDCKFSYGYICEWN